MKDLVAYAVLLGGLSPIAPLILAWGYKTKNPLLMILGAAWIASAVILALVSASKSRTGPQPYPDSRD